MTKTKLLTSVHARVDARGFIKFLEHPGALDVIAVLAYWPQLRGRKSLDVQAARRFLLSLGFILITAPRDYVLEGSGELAFTHPEGDAKGAQIALDILEGRLDVSVQLHRAARDLRQATKKTRRVR